MTYTHIHVVKCGHNHQDTNCLCIWHHSNFQQPLRYGCFTCA